MWAIVVDVREIILLTKRTIMCRKDRGEITPPITSTWGAIMRACGREEEAPCIHMHDIMTTILQHPDHRAPIIHGNARGMGDAHLMEEVENACIIQDHPHPPLKVDIRVPRSMLSTMVVHTRRTKVVIHTTTQACPSLPFPSQRRSMVDNTRRPVAPWENTVRRMVMLPLTFRRRITMLIIFLHLEVLILMPNLLTAKDSPPAPSRLCYRRVIIVNCGPPRSTMRMRVKRELRSEMMDTTMEKAILQLTLRFSLLPR